MDIPSDWWKAFFSGITVESWLRFMPEAWTRTEVDFFLREAAPPAAGRILDVPCGGGRHALELAARGFDVTGVDLSTDFLTHARAQSAKRGLPVTWEQRDMRDLPWAGAFDAALGMGNSFGYLDDAAAPRLSRA